MFKNILVYTFMTWYGRVWFLNIGKCIKHCMRIERDHHDYQQHYQSIDENKAL